MADESNTTPAKSGTGYARWKQLDADRNQLLHRLERYASVTIPKVLLPEDINPNTESIQHDWQSLGAQATNHLANKLMLALFSPGRPFFRLDPSKKLKQQMAELQVPEEQLRTALVGGEQEALRILDQKAIRPKLNQVFKHLIVLGNVLLDLSDDNEARVFGLRRYCVKRSCTGKVQEIVICERVKFDELEPDVQSGVQKSADAVVHYIRWYKRSGKRWKLTQWIDSHYLPGKDGAWDEDQFRLFPLTWDLADEHDYGTGHVEDYSGDFSALSVFSETEIKAALLASEYRWLADPNGITDVQDFRKSQNGDVLPGRKDDLALIHMTGTGALNEIRQTAEVVTRRIGQAFLLGSAVTRSAERVTAEEIRMQAQELESSLGGVYSRLAVDLQLPLAGWLLQQIDVDIGGTELVPTIVTGLDALSRGADSSSLAQFLSDFGSVTQLPPQALAYLNIREVMSVLAAGRGLDPSKFLKSEDQVAQEQQAAQEAALEAEAGTALAQEGAKAVSQGSNQ